MSDKQESLGLDEQKAERVEEYKFEPIKGYPMLNWRGKRPFTSTQFYPAQLKEVHGKEVDGWRNKIYWGDNLQVMSHLLGEFRGKVDLIYIDPPFDSKAEYKKQVTVRSKKAEGDKTAFEEKQYSDIWTNDEYLQFMYERLVLARELLSSSGSIYVHADWRMDSYLRMILDEIFGRKNYRNQIIWHYRRWTAKSNCFQKLHDVIAFYSASDDYKFNIQYTGYTEGSKQRKEQGVLHRFKLGEEPVLVSDGEANADGVQENDVWQIPFVAPSARERLGYPTQKPEKLLERIIAASSDPGDLVLDFFMGSGTTQAVALKMGRRFIGADINLGAIQTTTGRLCDILEEDQSDTTPGFELYNVNNYDLFRNPLEAKNLLTEALEIQPLEQGGLFDGEKDGRMVKIMPVNRIATKADLGEIVAGFDQKVFQRKQDEKPNQPVEKILLVCMGHEPDLKAELELQAKPFKIDVEVVDILRDKSQLEFKRDSEAKLAILDGELVIENFYPMNLLQKLSLQQEQVGEWRELVDSIMIDWNYDGAIFSPSVVDVPDKDEFVSGRYPVPDEAGTIRVKITDLLSESWEGEIDG